MRDGRQLAGAAVQKGAVRREGENRKMKLQVLVAAVNQDTDALAEKMNLETEAVIVNQCEGFACQEYLHKGRRIRCFSMAERGGKVFPKGRACIHHTRKGYIQGQIRQ